MAIKTRFYSIFVVLLSAMFLALPTMADIVSSFPDGTKYRIESIYQSGSSAAIGANHNVNSPLCITTSNTQNADCFWTFEHQGGGKYAIKNVSTGQYITLDDQYTNSPQILRYLHLSTSPEGDASLWYICNTIDNNGRELFYFQSVENSNYFFNVRTDTYALGAYSKGGIPSGSNETFNIYDDKGVQFSTQGDKPDDPDDEVDSTQVEPYTGAVLHVYRADGKIDAVPRAYINNVEQTDNAITILTNDDGPTFTYASYEVDSLSEVVPELGRFNSFKFNNKYNAHIIEDAEGAFTDDSLITLNVVGIGKTLRPSYKLDDDVQAFIGDSVQKSKFTRVRFDKEVVYTVARRGHTILRRTLQGDYVLRPYGREVKVQVDFATDHSTSTYNVPIIFVTTDDGTPITSKSRWWTGKVRIDGAGVFPDLPETPIQIKGRGNSSWTSSGKAPYHMKFDVATKVLGLKKGKHWNLIANAQSRSMTTNAVAMKMAQMVETAGFNHEIPVDLYVNGGYRGSYNLTEKVGLANNSIDLDNETYATLLELDSYYDETYKFRDATYNLPVNIKDPDFSEGTTKLTQQMIQLGFNRATAALKNREDMQYYFDLDYLARFLFVDDYTCNTELFHPKSTFLYNPNIMDSSTPFVYGPVWDFDWSFGYSSNYNYFTADATTDFWNCRSTSASQWVNSTRYCGENFNKIYYQLWHDFITDGRLDELIDFCDDYYQFAAPSFTHDNNVWGRGNAQTYASVTNNAKSWLRKRAEYIYNYMSNNLGYASKNYLDPTDGFLLGDANGDGRVTTADIVCVFNHILGLPIEDFEFAQADIDKNDIITVSDLINVRNIALTGSSKSGTFYGLPEAEAIISTGDVSYTGEGVSIPLLITVGEGDYSGVQFDLSVPAGMTVDNLDITRAIPDFDVEIAELNDALWRVTLYSSARHTLPLGRSELTLDLGWGDALTNSGNPDTQLFRASLNNVMFATSLGEDERSHSRSAEFLAEEPTGINGAVSIVDQQGNNLTLSATQNTVVPIYGVDGRVFRLYQLSAGRETITLPHGIYIINKQKIILP